MGFSGVLFPVAITAAAVNLSIRIHPAVMCITGANAGYGGIGAIIPAIPDVMEFHPATPTHRITVRFDAAGMPLARAYGGKEAPPAARLVVSIGTPAGYIAVVSDGASVQFARADGS